MTKQGTREQTPPKDSANTWVLSTQPKRKACLRLTGEKGYIDKKQGEGVCFLRDAQLSAEAPHPEPEIKWKRTPTPPSGSGLFIMQTHASESVDVQLWEQQQAVNQEPEEEHEIHHIRLLDELCQWVALRALALPQHGFSRVAGLPG